MADATTGFEPERFPDVVFEEGPLVAYFERGGQRFVYETLSQQGVKSEGQMPASESDAETAWQKYYPALGAYLARHKAKKVAWRVAPYAEERPEGGYWIRSRLVVTEKHDG